MRVTTIKLAFWQRLPKVSCIACFAIFVTVARGLSSQGRRAVGKATSLARLPGSGTSTKSTLGPTAGFSGITCPTRSLSRGQSHARRRERSGRNGFRAFAALAWCYLTTLGRSPIGSGVVSPLRGYGRPWKRQRKSGSSSQPTLSPRTGPLGLISGWLIGCTLPITSGCGKFRATEERNENQETGSNLRAPMHRMWR
jgi:hypothetical protein